MAGTDRHLVGAFTFKPPYDLLVWNKIEDNDEGLCGILTRQNRKTSTDGSTVVRGFIQWGLSGGCVTPSH